MLESYLAELLERAGVEQPHERAREIWLLSEGAISLILVHGDRSYAAAAATAAKRLLRPYLSKKKRAHRPRGGRQTTNKRVRTY